MKRFSFVLCVITIQFLNILSAKEKKGTDLEIVEQDFGLNGTTETVIMTLTHGFQPGSAIVIISQTDCQSTININDEKKNNLLQIDTRLKQGTVILNSRLKEKWADRMEFKPLVEKGAQSVTTIVYEEDGYSIFVNGKDFAFFKHRLKTPPKRVVAFRSTIYKMIYIAVKEGNITNTKNCPVL